MVRKKIADWYHDKMVDILKDNPIEWPTTNDYPITIHLTFVFGKYALDADNCTFMGKCIVDGLRKAEFIVDDTYKYVVTVSYTVIKGKKQENHIILEWE